MFLIKGIIISFLKSRYLIISYFKDDDVDVKKQKTENGKHDEENGEDEEDGEEEEDIDGEEEEDLDGEGEDDLDEEDGGEGKRC